MKVLQAPAVVLAVLAAAACLHATTIAAEGGPLWGGRARLVMVLLIQLLPNTTELGQRFPTLVYQSLLEGPQRTTLN